MTDTDRQTPMAAEGVTAYTLAMNYLPFIYLAVGVAIVVWMDGAGARVVLALAWIYLVPVAVGRVTIETFGRPSGRGLTQQSRAYKVWWFLTQMQMTFNRLPILEELMRLVPGLYSLWLNAWGSRVSPFSFWAPGSRVIDRYLVHVERGVVVGSGAVLSGHLGTVSGDGGYLNDIAAVTVGEGAILGASAKLGPGSRVAAGEQLPAGRILPPFVTWENGRKNRE